MLHAEAESHQWADWRAIAPSDLLNQLRPTRANGNQIHCSFSPLAHRRFFILRNFRQHAAHFAIVAAGKPAHSWLDLWAPFAVARLPRLPWLEICQTFRRGAIALSSDLVSLRIIHGLIL